jgi:hypothetical protein
MWICARSTHRWALAKTSFFDRFETVPRYYRFQISFQNSALTSKFVLFFERENKKYSIFYWEYFWAISTQVRIEHDLLLPMILMGEPLANCVKSLDCRCELVSEARTKTGNELLLLLLLLDVLEINLPFFKHI